MKMFYVPGSRWLAMLLLSPVIFPATVFSQTRRSDIAPGSLSATPTNFQVYNGNIYFLAKFSSNGSQLDRQEWFKFNPATNATTQLTNDHLQYSGVVIFRAPSRIGDNVFVSSAKNGYINLEFSRFDLTTETEYWTDLYPGVSGNPASSNSSDPITYGVDAATGNVYFNPSTSGYGNQLHVWKPADNSITRLTALNMQWPGMGQNSSAGIIVLDNYVYTTVSIGNSSSITNYFARIDKNTGAATIYSSVNPAIINPVSLRVFNNKIYFAARSGSGSGPGNLYCYDPVAGGDPVKLTNYTQTTADGNLSGFFTGVDGNLYVNVTYYNTSPLQGQLMRINPTTNAITYYDGGGGSTPLPNTYAFTTATDLYVTELANGKRDIVKYNLATKARTVLSTGVFSSASNFYLAANKKAYFSANDGVNGLEPWVLDVPSGNVSMLANINPGSANASPANFTEVNGQLFFSANDGVNGAELFSYNLPAALPLTLMNFNAAPAAKSVRLTWNVTAQTAMKEFGIERSTDGINFKNIGFTPAVTATTASYNFDDNAALPNAYYRLKMINADGTFVYSPVRRVEMLQKELLSLYPNPATGQEISLRLKRSITTDINYSIYDVRGAVMQTGLLKKGTSSLTIASLKSGHYILQLQIGETAAFDKL